MTDITNTELLKADDVVGKPVISLQGDELGSIGHVIVDPAQNSVIGFTVSIKGWFKNDKGMEFKAVKSFGQYAVTVETTDQIVPLDTLPATKQLTKANPLVGMRIVSASGKFIGTVDDYYFNNSTGKVERLVLTGGIIKNLFKGRASIPASSIQQVGKDAIIAVDSVEDTIETEEGGLQENFEQWKDDFDQFKDNLGQLKDEVGQWKKEIMAKTGEILTEQRVNLKASSEAWIERLQSIKQDMPLADSIKKALLGLKAGKTVTDNEGEVIISMDAEVSAEVIEKAEAAGKSEELVISVATKDLETQIESIKNEAEKTS